MAEQVPKGAVGSALRTGASAGVSMVGGIALGVVLAFALGLLSTIYYLVLWSSAKAALPADALGAGPVVVLVLLALTIPAYFFMGMNLGRGMALAKLVRRYGPALAQPLADQLATRIEALPAAHRTFHRGADVFSAEAAVEKLKPLVGDGAVVRKVVGMLMDRLPLSELMQEWGETRAAHGGGEALPGDPALRSFLAARIQQTLDGMASPALTWLGALLAVHAVVFGAGLWLLRG